MMSAKRILIPVTLLYAALSSPAYGNDNRIYHDSICGRTLSDTAVILKGQPRQVCAKAIEIRGNCALSRKGKAVRGTAFGVTWGNDSTGSRFQALLSPDSSSEYGDIIDRPAITLSIERISNDGNPQTVLKKKIHDNVELVRCNNTIAAEIQEGYVEIFVGDGELKSVTKIKIDSASAILPLGVMTKGCPEIEIAVTEHVPDRKADLSSEWTYMALKKYFSETDSLDPAEGFWSYLDRDNDPRYCRPGGTYSIAVASDRKGGFDIIYLDGAQTGASDWQTGMLKGRLQPTQFKDHYNLMWIDATMNELNQECSATIEQGIIMRCDFPLLKTTIRYSKTPTDK